MKTDMHYYGTYAMARAAGVSQRAAQTIATASEYVDEAIWDRELFLEDGRCILTEMTAHKMLDLKNADAEDQRNVWLPFHFLPGGEGGNVTDRLICGKDSRIAKAMVKQNIGLAKDVEYGLHLMGITAHVYADTFAHYGFMGANHSCNAVEPGSIELDVSAGGLLGYIQNKAEALWNEATSYGLSQMFPLGHGAVATYPDRPYLRWAYTQKGGARVERENPRDFIEGCKALHEMFASFLERAPTHGAPKTAKSWKAIRPVVKRIIETEGAKEERIKAWKKAMRDGLLFGGKGKRVPEYQGRKWSAKIDDYYFRTDPNIKPGRIATLPVYRFYQAARLHRAHTLADLLVGNGVIAA